MIREELLKDQPELLEFYLNLKDVYSKLGNGFLDKFERLPSMGDLFVDRWDRAKLLNFGKNSNIYENSLVIGNVKVGKESWIGPNTILDGSGNLSIGDYCTVSAGVHIYTHDNVKQTLTSKVHPIEQSEVSIGNNVYIGPNSVITKGLTIGNNCVIGTFSFINKSIPDNKIVIGQPGRVVGEVYIKDEEVFFKYYKKK